MRYLKCLLFANIILIIAFSSLSAKENVGVLFFFNCEGQTLDERSDFYINADGMIRFIENEVYPKKNVYFAVGIIREVKFPSYSLVLNYTKNKDKIDSALKRVSTNIVKGGYVSECLCDAFETLDMANKENFIFVISDSFKRNEYSKHKERQLCTFPEKYSVNLSVLALIGMPLKDIRDYKKLTSLYAGSVFLVRYRYPLSFNLTKRASFLLEGKESVFAYDNEIEGNWKYLPLSKIRSYGNTEIDLSQTELSDVENVVLHELHNIANTASPQNNISQIIMYYFYKRKIR